MPRRSSLLQPPEPHHLAGPRTLGSTVLGGSKATGRKRPIWCRLNNVRRLCCQILCTRIVDTVVLVVERKPEAAQASNLERDLRWALLAAQLLMLRGRVQERSRPREPHGARGETRAREESPDGYADATGVLGRAGNGVNGFITEVIADAWEAKSTPPVPVVRLSGAQASPRASAAGEPLPSVVGHAFHLRRVPITMRRAPSFFIDSALSSAVVGSPLAFCPLCARGVYW